MDKKEEQTPNQRMNVWVHNYSLCLESLIDETRRSENHEAYLRGVISGISLLQKAWLTGEFQKGKPCTGV